MYLSVASLLAGRSILASRSATARSTKPIARKMRTPEKLNNIGLLPRRMSG